MKSQNLYYKQAKIADSIIFLQLGRVLQSNIRVYGGYLAGIGSTNHRKTRMSGAQPPAIAGVGKPRFLIPGQREANLSTAVFLPIKLKRAVLSSRNLIRLMRLELMQPLRILHFL